MSRSAFSAASYSSSVVTSSGPSTGIVGPSQSTVPSGLDQRNGDSTSTPRPVGERAEEVDAAPLGRSAQADDEQDDGDRRRPQQPVGEQCRVAGRSQQRRSGHRDSGAPGHGSANRRVGSPGEPVMTTRTGSPAVSPRSSARCDGAPGRTSSTFAPGRNRRPERRDRIRADLGRQPLARAPSPPARTGRRPGGVAAVAVHERLRERADDDARLALPLPRAVVPPGDVAVAQPVLGRAAVALVPVHEPEPVAPPVEAALEPVHRLEEAAAVARLDVEPPTPAHASASGPRAPRPSSSTSAPRSRVTQSRAVPGLLAGCRRSRRGGRRRDEQRELSAPHVIALRRSSARPPGEVARTRPV